jgi:D-alanyl-D-alanine carboxypeptidase/D-alanyl-D-alanine-endopeptidase (penicillin-binding protein 4)
VRRAAAVLLVLLLLALLPGAASASKLCDSMRGRLLRGGGGASGLLVVDAETGKTVCARAPGAARPLASNMKLFTTSTALTRFGPEYRIATELLGDGGVDGHGVLHGSLYLRGAGDPALGEPAFYDRFLGGVGTDVFDLAGGLREAGVKAVSGRLYADDSVFDRLRGVADSGYATSPYIGPLSGLSFDSGYSDAGASGFAAEPAKEAAAALAASLRSSGVSIRGEVARAATPPGATTLATVRSPTMAQLVQTTDVYSDNFFAEMLLKLLGAHFGGAGTTSAGTGVVERFARAEGSGVHAVDGSGLTRSNRASPRQVVRLLLAMRAGPIGEQFVDDLALTGHTGTVADRTHGTAAYGRCRTKTGTLTGVSNLSGFCFNRDGRVMAFSILMGSVGDLTLAHYEQDLIAAAVASY